MARRRERKAVTSWAEDTAQSFDAAKAWVVCAGWKLRFSQRAMKSGRQLRGCRSEVHCSRCGRLRIASSGLHCVQQVAQTFTRLEIIAIELQNKSVFVARQAILAARRVGIGLVQQVGNVLPAETVDR